jgi:hypothetical protein
MTGHDEPSSPAQAPFARFAAGPLASLSKRADPRLAGTNASFL